MGPATATGAGDNLSAAITIKISRGQPYATKKATVSKKLIDARSVGETL